MFYLRLPILPNPLIPTPTTGVALPCSLDDAAASNCNLFPLLLRLTCSAWKWFPLREELKAFSVFLWLCFWIVTRWTPRLECNENDDTCEISKAEMIKASFVRVVRWLDLMDAKEVDTIMIRRLLVI